MTRILLESGISAHVCMTRITESGAALHAKSRPHRPSATGRTRTGPGLGSRQGRNSKLSESTTAARAAGSVDGLEPVVRVEELPAAARGSGLKARRSRAGVGSRRPGPVVWATAESAGRRGRSGGGT